MMAKIVILILSCDNLSFLINNFIFSVFFRIIFWTLHAPRVRFSSPIVKIDIGEPLSIHA